VLDGEAVVLGVDGISDFNALHSGRHNEEVQLCAFDVLAMDGDDLRPLPLSMRKANLARLLRGRPEGISSSIRSSVGRSVLISSLRRAGWDWRDWCPSAATVRIRRAGQSTGSR
jgi:ATP-dependent DNA ligase